MAERLLVLSAGSGPSNNLIRSLQAGDSSLFIVGCHADRFALKKSLADRNYLTPPSSRPEFPRALRRIIKAERIDLVVPNSEADVTTISNLRDRLPCRTFLPRKAVIERCQDKYSLTAFLRHRGLPLPVTYPVIALKDVERIFRRFSPHSKLWCRIRKGSGSFGAIPVKSPEQARNWIKYWQEMCKIPAGSFTLSEYLPGRDYCLQSLWKEGTLFLSKMHERLSYYVAGSSPSGVSSTAGVAKMIFEPGVVEVCSKAIRALDRRASGVFFVDLKENVHGSPCITEINAGRFANVSTIHDATVKSNMALTYVRLALGERVKVRKAHDRVDDNCYVLRDLDTLPAVLRSNELLEGIEDARG